MITVNHHTLGMSKFVQTKTNEIMPPLRPLNVTSYKDCLHLIRAKNVKPDAILPFEVPSSNELYIAAMDFERN